MKHPSVGQLLHVSFRGVIRGINSDGFWEVEDIHPGGTVAWVKAAHYPPQSQIPDVPAMRREQEAQLGHYLVQFLKSAYHGNLKSREVKIVSYQVANNLPNASYLATLASEHTLSSSGRSPLDALGQVLSDFVITPDKYGCPELITRVQESAHGHGTYHQCVDCGDMVGACHSARHPDDIQGGAIKE